MANEKVNKKTLGYLGEDYQYRLVKCFMEDSRFFGNVCDIVEPAYFTNTVLRMVVGAIRDYYRKEAIVPSYDILRIMLLTRSVSEVDRQESIEVVEKIKSGTGFDGNQQVEDVALKFFKQQNYLKIAKRIIDIAEKGDMDYDEVDAMWQSAVLEGGDDDFGYSIFDKEDSALSTKSRISIPTGVAKLDEILNGGLDKRKLGVIIGSAGFGKSTFSTAISAFASTFRCDMNNHEGYKVLQIYFEDDDDDLVRKHFARIATTEVGRDIEARNLSRTQEDAEQIRMVLDNYHDKETMRKNLRLKSFPTNTKSASDIKVFIKRLINTGFKPDLVVLDYFECLKPEPTSRGNDSEWKRQGDTMRALESMAKELNIALWVPTQGTKGSFTSDLVTLDQAGGSVIKVQVAAVIVTIARTPDDQDNNKATLAVLKNRSGKSGEVFRGINFNNGTSIISCDDVITFNNTNDWRNDSNKKAEERQINYVRQFQNDTSFDDLPI